MVSKSVTTAIFILTIILAAESEAASCLGGNCHSILKAPKYLHGPVAAEQAGAPGCIACHVPAGKPCSQKSKGVFKPLAPVTKMCQMCHSRGTGTQHSVKKVDCLKCHDPHGSDKNAELKR